MSKLRIDKEIKSLKEWCAQYDVPYVTVRKRLHSGWPLKRALTTPTGRLSSRVIPTDTLFPRWRNMLEKAKREGIAVYSEWRAELPNFAGFKQFKEDVGDCPIIFEEKKQITHHQAIIEKISRQNFRLTRINKNDGYNPQNYKWLNKSACIVGKQKTHHQKELVKWTKEEIAELGPGLRSSFEFAKLYVPLKRRKRNEKENE